VRSRVVRPAVGLDLDDPPGQAGAVREGPNEDLVEQRRRQVERVPVVEVAPEQGGGDGGDLSVQG
jgi:hypothetical protein